METLKVRVANGKLVGEAPTGLAEGTELELCLAAPDDEMSESELEALNESLDRAWHAIKAGRVRPAMDVVNELRARR